MKKKHIYLHLGTTKTGTTSIQGFLIHNRDTLKRYNFTPYTPGGNSNPNAPYRLRTFVEFMQEAARNKMPFLSGEQQQWLNNLIEIIKHAETDNIILSDELLWNAINVPRKKNIFIGFIELLKEFADITAIVYLRRQDSFLMSSYQQRIKGGKMKGKDCQQWLAISGRGQKNVANYQKQLERILPLFGKNNIIVRLFEKEQFVDQSLFADFMHCIGLRMNEEFEIPNERRNPGVSPFMAELLRCLSVYDYNKDAIRLFLHSKNKRNNKFFNLTRQHKFLSPKERIALMQCYKKGNEWVAREFLDRENGVIFREPLPDINEPWEKYQLNPDEVKTFFAEANFLDEKQRKTMQKQVLTALREQKWLSRKFYFIRIIKNSPFEPITRFLYKRVMSFFSGRLGEKS